MIIIKQEELDTVGEVKPNSLIQGDCLQVMKFLADKSIDMVLCDLPYG
jgi:DNA modification methylase